MLLVGDTRPWCAGGPCNDHFAVLLLLSARTLNPASILFDHFCWGVGTSFRKGMVMFSEI